MCYLSLQAARARVRARLVVAVLLEAGSRGPANRVLSGRFLRSNRDFTGRKVDQGGVAAGADVERHVCRGWRGDERERERRGGELEQQENRLLLHPLREQITFHLSGPTHVSVWWPQDPYSPAETWEVVIISTFCFQKKLCWAHKETLYKSSMEGWAWPDASSWKITPTAIRNVNTRKKKGMHVNGHISLCSNYSHTKNNNPNCSKLCIYHERVLR